MIFVFIGAGSLIADRVLDGGLGLVGIALAHALALGVVVSATGHISGGHINPAVTLGFVLVRRIKVSLGVAYVVAQLAGAVIAVLLLRGLFPGDAAKEASYGATLLAPGMAAWKGMLMEAALTFALVTAVFGTAVHPNAPRGIGGFGIGLTLGVAILVGGPLTGASLNPARTFGPALAGGVWSDHWAYWVGPLLGGAIGAMAYEYLFLRGRGGEEA